MRSTLMSNLRICSTHCSLVFFPGNVVHREKHLASKLYGCWRFFSSKITFPKDGVTGTTQSKVPENKRSNRNASDIIRKAGRQQESKKWRDTSLQGPSSKSVFAAGTAKTTAEVMRRAAPLASRKDTIQLEKTKLPARPLTVAEWKEMKESMGNMPLFETFIMLKLCNAGADVDIAKSLLTFVVTETGTLSYELLLKYLALCVMGGHDSEASDVYDIMRTTFPSVETSASSLFIKSFCRTDRWREALVILQDLKRIITPTSRNYGEIVSAATKHNDLLTAWGLYDELMDRGLSPHAETWEALFTGPQSPEESQKEERTMPRFEHEKRLLGLLHHMRNNQIYPQKNLAHCIKTWFESLEDQNWEGRWTSVTPRGTCRCCGRELESIQLTAEEYQLLKTKVMVNVIEGPDVFKKTNPKELESFKAFVKRKPAFDVVVDGLNVAYIKHKNSLSETLLTVVSKLTEQGLKVLVLGRKHMLSSRLWNRDDMKLLQQKAHCFFTENISEDDPFLLYAALNSGNHCQFVSRDLMRDHKAVLPDEATRRLFFKWQRGHQLRIDSYNPAGRNVFFKGVPTYDTIIQTSAGSWHIPFDDSPDRTTYEDPQKWLCLSNQQKNGLS